VEMRAKILDAALRLFSAYGYDAVGVQTIVETVEVTKPTLYHYFNSKRGLFEALVKEHGDPLIEVVREATSYQGDITQSIQRVVRVYFDYAETHPTFYRMMLAMWFAPSSSEYFASIHDLLYRQHLMIEQMFVAASRDHGNMLGRQQAYTISLKGLIDTYIGAGLQGYLDLRSEHVEYRVAHQFMHGIFS
jgi:AcrR family transcriptional regulator